MVPRFDGEAGGDSDVADLRAPVDEAHGHFGMAQLAAAFLHRHGDFVG
jgi:hypothetical protein